MPAIPQAGAVSVFRIILEMFHVKHFCPIEAQNLTRPKTTASSELVRSTDFLVQLESDGGSAPTAPRGCGSRHQCKFGEWDAEERCADVDPVSSSNWW
jgi:hypothetical protein